ncbi:DUF1801 domain-containing protein [Candidatus Haliotispira prima]|uniref:DUF1801 domain-containing protein n=1 Tax=Candidatus Haliotispira prima TaxID=3034016 RepID=A0ABY8MK61_9SPIO|nr:DUF1801 domain-containing protein [Candidatus Haliotispira prima]
MGLKTRPNSLPAGDYLRAITDQRKRDDGFALLDIFRRVTCFEPVMWGDSIVGFGQYSYSNTKGHYNWLMTGYSVRSKSLTLYVMQGFDSFQSDLAGLGAVKHSKSCLYLNKLADVDLGKLELFLSKVTEDMKRRYPCSDVEQP